MNEGIDPYYYAQQLAAQKGYKDNMIFYQLDTTKEIYLLMNRLLGKDINSETGEFERKDYLEPIMGEKGAAILMSFLEPRISKISSLSKLDDQEIRNITYHFSEDLVFFIGRHKSEFGFKSDQAASSIINLFDDLFYTTLKKAVGAHQSDSINKNFSYIEHSGKQVITEDRPKQQFFTNMLRQ